MSLLLVTPSSAVTRIDVIKGVPVKPGDYAWQVALVQAGRLPTNGTFCGGTLVSAEWVLTAAHCLYTKDCKKKLTRKDFLIGHSNHRLSAMTVERVAESVEAAGYECGKFYNDIALVRLAVPILNAQVIRLATAEDEAAIMKDGKELHIAGWGFTRPAGERSATLLEAKVSVIPFNACNGGTQYNGRVPANSICASDPGVDTCDNDSGGPLLRHSPSGSIGDATQIAVVSHGDGCARPDRPGVYARITPHLAWIASKTAVTCTAAAIARGVC